MEAFSREQDERSLLGNRMPRLDPDGRSTELGRRMIYFLLAALASVAAGISVVYVEPILVFGVVLGLLFLLVIVRWPFIGLLLYLLIFLLRLGEMVPALAPLRMERLTGVLTLASLFFAQLLRDGRLTVDRSRVTKKFLFLMLSALLSVPTSYWFSGAWKGVTDYFKLFLFYLMIVMIIDTRRKFLAFVTTYLLLIGYIAWQSVSAYLHGSLLFAQGIERAEGVTSAGGGPNELGATMACTIPLLLLLGLNKKFGRWRWVYLGLLALCGYTLVTTGSRSGLIGFLASIGYLAWTSRHRVLYSVVGGVLLMGLFFALPAQYQGRYATMTKSELDGSSQERIKVWTKGLHMVLDRPLFGVGINCFETANAYSYSSGPTRSWLESHSLYVQVPAEMGLVGAFAWFGLLIEHMVLNRRISRRLGRAEEETAGSEAPEDWTTEKTILKAMFAGIVALIFTGVFGHSMMRYTWYVYGGLALVVARIHLQRLDATQREEEQRAFVG